MGRGGMEEKNLLKNVAKMFPIYKYGEKINVLPAYTLVEEPLWRVSKLKLATWTVVVMPFTRYLALCLLGTVVAS